MSSRRPVARRSLRADSHPSPGSRTSNESSWHFASQICAVADLHGFVPPKLLAADAAHLGRALTVAGEESVHPARDRVARIAGIDQQHSASAAAEDERRVSPAGPPPAMVTS